MHQGVEPPEGRKVPQSLKPHDRPKEKEALNRIEGSHTRGYTTH
ncbi:hypothetical protein [Stenomitos frigidus]|nr:hypothetical protein [Stenomitos frigidus]